MFILHKIENDPVCEHLERIFNPIGHAAVKVLGEDSGERGVDFGGLWAHSVEFKDTTAEIGREGEINEGNLVVKVHDDDECVMVFYKYT